MQMREMREQHEGIKRDMRALLDVPGGAGGDLSPEQATKFDGLKDQAKALETRMERQAFIDEMDRRAAGSPVDGSGDNRLESQLDQFSLRKALAGAAGLKVDDGREREISTELERRSGRKAEGIMVPYKVMMEKRVVSLSTPTGYSGSNLIQTDVPGALYIDRLREKLVVRRLGARVITGLVGNLAMPKLTSSGPVYWVGDNSPVTASDPDFAQVSMSPHHAGTVYELSRSILLQDSVDIETLLRDDLAKLLAVGVDSVAIQGGGSNQPTGILGTTGIGNVAMGTNGGNITWASIVNLIAQVQNQNTDGNGFISNPKVVAQARQTQRIQSTDSHMIMDDPTTLAGYPIGVSTLVPSTLTKGGCSTCSALIFGDFTDLVLGFWSELDILVNPFESTAYPKGNVQVRAMATLDVGVRHVQSFAAIKDITA